VQRVLRPVLVAIPPSHDLTGPEQVARQRDYARRALEQCAKLCGAPKDGWEKDDMDVPLPNAGFHWSVAHKRRWAAAVISDQPVGIDIERIKPRREELFDDAGTPREWTLLGGRTWPAFFRLWTAKEAVLKAYGIGMAGWNRCSLAQTLDDRHLRLTFNEQSIIVEHYYHQDHVAAVTTRGAVAVWHLITEKP
jgi:4'-phosphopantetheinyl transferase